MASKHNAADPVAVEAERKRLKIRRDQELEDVKDIISRPEGIRFFRRMMNEGLVFTTTFTGNSYGFFNEGHRNFALRYLHDIRKVASGKIAELMEEKTDEEEA